MTLRVPVTARDHSKGQGLGGVTLVEYGDYQCSYCALAQPIIKQIQSDFGENLRFAYRQFPLSEIHPDAEGAAEFAEFAGVHQKFWETHDALFDNQADLGMDLYLSLGRSLELSGHDIARVLESGTYASKVKSDIQGGVRSGVNGTPAFFINACRYERSYQYAELHAAITDQLTLA